MKKSLILLTICFLSVGLLAQSTSNLSKSDMVKLDFKILAASKAKIKSNDPSKIPAYSQLLKDADALLKYKPVSVMDKKDLPPSGDKHDYMSIAPYWWPDPSKPGGVPYIRKDGVVNPETKNYPDKTNLPKLCENVYTLSLAYYFSNDEKYAKHAGKLINVWFLDSATSMNPNLKFGQAIKGITDGRGAGIIEARHLIFLLDGIALLKTSENFNAEKQKMLKAWFTEFLSWLRTSEIGKDEMDAKNNHGVWYDALSLSIANFIGDKSMSAKIIESAMDRLDKQMDNQGSFPEEMTRTISLHYSVFVINAFLVIAQLSEDVGTDFWNLKTPSGKSLSKAINYTLPFITNEKKWHGPQIKEFDIYNAFPILLRGASKYNCKSCVDTMKKETEENFEKLLLNLL